MGRIWTFLRIMNVRLRFIFLMVLVGLIAGHWESLMNRYDRWRRPPQASAAVEAQAIEFFCPMHPSIVRADMGSCPICGMPLSKRTKTASQTIPQGVLAQVQLTPQRVQMGRIATTPVGYRLLSREIRTVGIIDYDETRLAYISARIKGRIDKLMVNYVGQQIRKGDPLVLIYSPDLLVTQKDLIANQKWSEQEKKTRDTGVPSSVRTFADAARQRLLLWGVTEQQIEELIRRGTPETHLTIHSSIGGIVTQKDVLEGDYVSEGTRIYTIADLSNVWMQAKIFEDQIAGVSVGTAVEVTSTAYPNEVFAGRITFIAYTVDPATRTIAARVEIANPDLKLRPGMYANAAIRLPVGKVTEISTTSRSATSSAPAGSEDTYDLTRAYLAMCAVYSKDKTDAAGLSKLIAAAERARDQVPGNIRPKVAALLDRCRAIQNKDLKAQREAFKPVSQAMIDLLRIRPPAKMKLYVVHCPMAKADWLSNIDEVINPYYGSEMLECGNVVGPLEPAKVLDDERFASGYFCPIYPDRLYETTHLCPIDKFPMKYARIEKVLAVAESAVINTGTRRIVYRQSSPGAFDMIEVTLGPRAGEFYPVLSGLKSGEHVVTAGAFLVDAENRLNPAAGATYFGASGGG